MTIPSTGTNQCSKSRLTMTSAWLITNKMIALMARSIHHLRTSFWIKDWSTMRTGVLALWSRREAAAWAKWDLGHAVTLTMGRVVKLTTTSMNSVIITIQTILSLHLENRAWVRWTSRIVLIVIHFRFNNKCQLIKVQKNKRCNQLVTDTVVVN